MLVQEARTQRDNFNAVVTAIKPVLDCLNMEPGIQLDGRRQRLDTIIQRCKTTWENFKSFNHATILSVATHVLAVVRSHYPAIDLQAIGDGFTDGRSDAETQQLEDQVEDSAKKLVDDIDLFGETDDNGGVQ